MKSVILARGRQLLFLSGMAFGFLLAHGDLALAEPNFLANVPAGTSTYKAIAKIGVRTPSTYDINTKEFVFAGGPEYYFEVTGDIQIWRSGPLDSFVDPISGLNYGTNGDGFNTLRLEFVNLSNINITNPAGATITSIQLGDGVTGGSNNGPLFSTGGAVEIAPDGSIANGFMNLFLETNITAPNIIVPGELQGAPFFLDASYPIGLLHNNTALHLEAQISEFPPGGISFLLTNGPVGAFAPTSNAFVQALAGLPAPFNRPLSEMQFAQFISADLQIVPEPSSIAFGLMAGGLFGGLVWRRRRAQANAA